jgi:circadian clock protein KaiC
VRVPKFRGSKTRSGEHAYRITGDGMAVFPALAPSEHHDTFSMETLSSGIPAVDALLNGGLGRGTATVISGPTGVGKTTLSTQFASESAAHGERSVVYQFEERASTFLTRSENIGIPVHRMIDSGTLDVREIDALDLSPQEFAGIVREDVERHDTRMVVIDGIAGYRLTLSGETDMLLRRLHALGQYLKNVGVTTILVDETAGVTGAFTATEENISYLADNITFLRHLEHRGESERPSAC